eukprot:366085-Chlamydomonas_euryale.AAC.5
MPSPAGGRTRLPAPRAAAAVSEECASAPQGQVCSSARQIVKSYTVTDLQSLTLQILPQHWAGMPHVIRALQGLMLL